MIKSLKALLTMTSNQKDRMHLNAKPSTFRHAIKLRTKTTPAEKILWMALRNKLLNGLKFRRQHPISRYVLDFYCHRARLGIELDGGYHEEKSQKLYDLDRTENLALYDIEIIRFKNENVIDDLQKTLKTIEKKCKARIEKH
jgi:very-short-patch-repair endonuclease